MISCAHIEIICNIIHIMHDTTIFIDIVANTLSASEIVGRCCAM